LGERKGIVPNLKSIALKVFVPAKDYEVSKRFYRDVGFTLESESEILAHFLYENIGFLLQRFYTKEFAENLVLHLLVEDVDAWWEKLSAAGIAEKYAVRMSAVKQQPWGMRDFTLHDPSGVLWRIAQQ
jgi:catechol 2,3-dioxygenase-like lactoylglutathione lyase family enzyme